MKIAVINGPNLQLLGTREPDIYGKADYAALKEKIERHCESAGVQVVVLQSDSESEIVGMIHRCRGRADGIVINPAAYTHTSVALLDALKAVGLPAVEVHISDVSARESFRSVSYVRAACIATVAGRGFDGYTEAIDLLCDFIRSSGREPAAGELSHICGGPERVARFEHVTGYPDVRLPERATAGSAGYDFFAPRRISLSPGETVTVDTGVRCRMKDGYVLLLFPRSSLGFKYRLALDNTVGVIDADYYFALNEGHIRIRMTNGGDRPLEIEAGSAFAQGVFLRFGITEDDCADGIRTGGFGSTDAERA